MPKELVRYVCIENFYMNINSGGAIAFTKGALYTVEEIDDDGDLSFLDDNNQFHWMPIDLIDQHFIKINEMKK